MRFVCLRRPGQSLGSSSWVRFIAWIYAMACRMRSHLTWITYDKTKRGPAALQVLKKIVRLASVFPSPPFRSSDFAGLRRPRLYGFHTGTRSLSNRKGRGRRSGGREREPRRAGEGRLSLESKLLHPRYHPGYHPRIPAQPMSRLGPSSGRPRPREEWGLQVVPAGAAEGELRCHRNATLLNQSVVDGVEGQLEPVRNPELVENVMEAGFDGLFADEELFPDFLVPVALSYQLDDFLLAVAELGLSAGSEKSADGLLT